MLTSILTWFAGAKRWLNEAAVKALAIAVIVIAVLIGAALLYGAGKSNGGAATNWRWLSQMSKLNERWAKQRAARAAAQAQASAEAARRAEAERDQALERAVALEAELQALKARGEDTPIISADERRRLFR